VATTTAYFLEFELDSLDLNYFNIQHGMTLPCYLSGFSGGASGKSQGAICIGYSSGVSSTSPLIVRVLNFAGFTAGRNIKLSLDNFINPPVQRLFVVPINVRMRMQDRTN
jgi:hypothetical protein